MATVRFNHIALTCEAPLITEAFYAKHFGFRRARVYAPGPDQVVMLAAGDVYLELFRATQKSAVAPPSGSGYEYPGWRHICFAVNDLDAKLRDMGADANIALGPLDMSELIAGMRVCWVRDPDGNIVELNQGYRDDPALTV